MRRADWRDFRGAMALVAAVVALGTGLRAHASEQGGEESPTPAARVARPAQRLTPERFVEAVQAMEHLRVGDLATHRQRRRWDGVIFASRPLAPRARLLHGSACNAGLLPEALAQAILGQQVHSFRQMRRVFWRAVADSAYANEFGEVDQALMRLGQPPRVHPQQAMGHRRSYELHHIKPLSQGGAPYDLANLCVVTPRFHQQVLHPPYHFGRATPTTGP